MYVNISHAWFLTHRVSVKGIDMIPTNCCYHPSKGPGVFFKNAYCIMIGATYLIGTIAFGTFEAYIPTCG